MATNEPKSTAKKRPRLTEAERKQRDAEIELRARDRLLRERAEQGFPPKVVVWLP